MPLPTPLQIIAKEPKVLIIKMLKGRIANYQLKKFHAAPKVAELIDIRISEIEEIIKEINTKC